MDERKPFDRAALHLDRLIKHGKRTNPQGAITIEWSIDDVEFFRFAVSRHADHLVEFVLVMAIGARAEGAHGIFLSG